MQSRLTLDWAAELRRFRHERGFKQSVLAELLGVDQATISRWENGRSRPELGMQRRIRDLIAGRADISPRVLDRIVSLSPALMLVVDERLQVRGVSRFYAERAGAPLGTIAGRRWIVDRQSDHGRMCDEAIERGLLRAQVALVDYPNRHTLPSGDELLTVESWLPILVEGTCFVLVVMREIDAEELERRRRTREWEFRVLTAVLE